MNKSNFKIKASDGIELFVSTSIIEEAIYAILLIHGLGEHSGRYNHVIDTFNDQNISVVTMDIRGHGKSTGKRGHASSYKQLLNDIELFIQIAKPLTKNQKRILYGHSMGGNLVINYLIQKSTNFLNGAILSSPAFSPAFKPPKIKITMGKIFQKLVPSLTLNNELQLNGISRNNEVVENYKKDPLNHDRLSVRLGLDLLKYGKHALDNAENYNFPTLILHGQKDILTSYYSSEKFSNQAGNQIEFKGIESGYHELHNEPEKNELFNSITNWIKKL